MNFFKNFLTAVLGTLTAIGLFFALVLMLLSATASLLVSPPTEGVVKSNSILDLNLNVPITDRNPEFDELALLFELNEEVLGLP
ncbi:MAG: signal peptide peptidase SppA, partial [Flavobacteriia bacterium]|nr:signal peptide peptidase SppA [Flavobacteriia bacterium]